MRYNDGFIVGTGAALNISIGFIPSWVRVLNLSDGNALHEGPVGDVIHFDTGGPDPIRPGDQIVAADGGWSATVSEVMVYSGTWDASDAAGYIQLEAGSIDGQANIANDDVIHVRPQQGAAGTPVQRALMNAAGLEKTGVKVSAAVAPMGPNMHIRPYRGGDDDGPGFTIQSDISADNKLLGYQAWSPDPGSAPLGFQGG